MRNRLEIIHDERLLNNIAGGQEEGGSGNAQHHRHHHGHHNAYAYGRDPADLMKLKWSCIDMTRNAKAETDVIYQRAVNNS